MNLGKLFLYQSELDAHIEDKHPRLKGESRHDKKVLSLLVELGELANEARFFKFWSDDQVPRVAEIVRRPHEDPNIQTAVIEYKNPLREEFVDGIHFLLSIGLENGIEELDIKPIKKNTLTEQFISLYNCFTVLSISFSVRGYSQAWSAYLGLMEMLGFTWEEVEREYITKNTVNHERQDGGY